MLYSFYLLLGTFKINIMDLEKLKELFEQLKKETEEYIDHEKMVDKGEDYLLLIAMAKYIERYG